MLNARKHSPEGTLVIVQGIQDEETIIISIHDEGDGIPEKDLPFVFKRLYQVDKSKSSQYRGSGLGLVIAADAKEATPNLTLDFDTQDEQSGLVMIGAPAGC